MVELHFDPAIGWPKDPSVLTEEDVRLLTGGKRSWKLKYTDLHKLPSFMGLYCGNTGFAFLVSGCQRPFCTLTANCMMQQPYLHADALAGMDCRPILLVLFRISQQLAR